MLIYVSPPARAVRDLPLPATPEWVILRRNGAEAGEYRLRGAGRRARSAPAQTARTSTTSGM